MCVCASTLAPASVFYRAALAACTCHTPCQRKLRHSRTYKTAPSDASLQSLCGEGSGSLGAASVPELSRHQCVSAWRSAA